MNEKDKISRKQFGTVRTELQKQTVTFKKETRNLLEKAFKYFKEQTSKVIDNLLEKQDNSRFTKNIEMPDKKYYPRVIPGFAKQL